jgi:hypothetical protein
VQTYTGRVIDGKVVVDGDPPPDGTEVTVQVAGDEEPFELTPDMEAELEAAIERLDRGQFVTWEEVRDRLMAIERRADHAPA